MNQKLILWALSFAAGGFLLTGASFAFQQVMPWFSETACVIHASKDSGTSHGVAACDRRFKAEKASFGMSQEDIETIDGRAGFVNGRFVAQIYNGSYLNINKLRIAVIDPDTAESDEPFVRNYEVSAQISSLSSGEISFNTFEEYDQAQWYIVNAWGSIGD